MSPRRAWSVDVARVDVARVDVAVVDPPRVARSTRRVRASVGAVEGSATDGASPPRRRWLALLGWR